MPNGTLTANGTEQDVFVSSPGRDVRIEAYVSLRAMLAGDTTVMRIYQKVDGTNYDKVYERTFTGVQANPQAWHLNNAWTDGTMNLKVTLQQTAGVNRAYAWRYKQQA